MNDLNGKVGKETARIRTMYETETAAVKDLIDKSFVDREKLKDRLKELEDLVADSKKKYK